MKKILLALTIIGAMSYSAEAQSKKSIYDKNYKMCMNDNGYHVCTHAEKDMEQIGRDVKVTADPASLSMMNTYVHMGYRSVPGHSNKRNSNIVVTYEDPNGAYQGKETRINDGVQKNKVRNINYLDASVTLPPNDGN